MKLNESEKCSFSYTVFYSDETRTYGISCSDGEGNTVKSIDDITASSDTIGSFCAMLNSARIHPYHFYDVYEDFFG